VRGIENKRLLHCIARIFELLNGLRKLLSAVKVPEARNVFNNECARLECSDEPNKIEQ